MCSMAAKRVANGFRPLNVRPKWLNLDAGEDYINFQKPSEDKYG